MLHAVIFDLDETLIDWSAATGNWRDSLPVFLAPLHENLHNAGHKVPNLQNFAGLYINLMSHHWQLSREPLFQATQHHEILAQLLEDLGIKTSPEQLEQYERSLRWRLAPGVRLYPDTLSSLQSLQANAIRTGLVTNSPYPMWSRDIELETLGILDYLEVRLTAADAGFFKPNPHPFHAALKQLGVGTKNAVMIGDDLARDIGGARDAGLRGIWLNRMDEQPPYDIQPDAIASSLTEALDILEDWYPGWRKKP